MVKATKSKPLQVILLISLVAFLVTAFVLGVQDINRKDAARLKGYEDAATPVGVARAKQDCTAIGLKAEICDGITGSTGTSECGGMTCWIVYVHTSDPDIYRASVTVSKQNGRYVVVDYLRNDGTRP